MKSPLRLLVLALAFLLGGCTSAVVSHSDSTQFNATDIAPDEVVSVILNRFRQCEEDNPTSKDRCVDSSSESDEQSFERSVTQSLLELQPKLNILSAKEFRRIAFSDKEITTLPHTQEAIIELLHDNEFKQRINAARLRYLVILDVETRIWGKSTKYIPPSPGDHLAISGIDRGGEKRSTVKASIVDMRRAIQVGAAEGISTGETGYKVPLVFLILPLPLIVPYGANTESHACAELGHELGQKFFLTSDPLQAPQ